MIKKILVALDGSDHATHALNFALDLAEKYSAEIQLLTVVPPILIPTYSFYVLKQNVLAECAKQLETSFRGVLSKAVGKAKKEKPNLKVFTKLEHGDPDEKIVETAERGDFDIIVMGSRGLGRRQTALGSVSSKVVDKATCPVLIHK